MKGVSSGLSTFLHAASWPLRSWGELIKQMKGFIDDDTKVVIDRKEYESLLEDSVWLSALKSAGVDNWEGYDEAHIILKEMKEEN